MPQVATTVTAAPIFVAMLNLWRNRQPIGIAKWITCIAAVLGVALLVTDGALHQLTGTGQSLLGLMLAICCAALVGGYALFSRPVIARFGALALWLVVGALWGQWVDPTTLFDARRARSPPCSPSAFGIRRSPSGCGWAGSPPCRTSPADLPVLP